MFLDPFHKLKILNPLSRGQTPSKKFLATLLLFTPLVRHWQDKTFFWCWGFFLKSIIRGGLISLNSSPNTWFIGTEKREWRFDSMTIDKRRKKYRSIFSNNIGNNLCHLGNIDDISLVMANLYHSSLSKPLQIDDEKVKKSKVSKFFFILLNVWIGFKMKKKQVYSRWKKFLSFFCVCEKRPFYGFLVMWVILAPKWMLFCFSSDN